MRDAPFPIGATICFTALMIAASAMPGSGPVVGVALFVAAFVYAARRTRPAKPPGE